MNPYTMMVVLYLFLAILMSVDSALTGLQILPAFSGLRWLRVHFITLGAVTEALFGVLPLLVASRHRLPRPAIRWDMWIALNAGLLLLLAGIPQYNALLVISGGSLIFIAVLLLIHTLHRLRPEPTLPAEQVAHQASEGRKFYLAGLSYFLVGILVGSGLWFGWADWLHIKNPLEVHIHANIWGFASLVFAGLLVDLYPRFANRPLAWPRSITPIFSMMVIGASALVLGPWLQATWLTAPGILLYLIATGWLLANVIQPLIGDRRAWTAGMLHLLIAYAWILAPILGAPLTLLNIPGLDPAGIERDAPMTLVYSWVLQASYALVPFFFYLIFHPGDKARLGGTWVSLISINIASVLLWASLLAGSYRPMLNTIAYIFLGVSMLPILIQLGRILSTAPSQLEPASFEPPPVEKGSRDA